MIKIFFTYLRVYSHHHMFRAIRRVLDEDPECKAVYYALIEVICWMKRL